MDTTAIFTNIFSPYLETDDEHFARIKREEMEWEAEQEAISHELSTNQE